MIVFWEKQITLSNINRFRTMDLYFTLRFRCIFSNFDQELLFFLTHARGIFILQIWIDYFKYLICNWNTVYFNHISVDDPWIGRVQQSLKEPNWHHQLRNKVMVQTFSSRLGRHWRAILFHMLSQDSWLRAVIRQGHVVALVRVRASFPAIRFIQLLWPVK